MEDHNRPDRLDPRHPEDEARYLREHQDKDFPGYPHHPASEDIMNTESGFEKADINVERITPAGQAVSLEDESYVPPPPFPDPAPSYFEDTADVDDTSIVMGTEADVTREDLVLLGDPDRDQDLNDDESMDNYQGLDDRDFDGEPLNEFAGSIAATGDDLDVPGAEFDGPAGAALGDIDEDNSYFSLGGDEKDSLREQRPDINVDLDMDGGTDMEG
jgi:hypothetical protein